LWGLFTGAFLILEKLFLGKWLLRLPYLIANLFTFFIFITALLIFKIEQGEQLADVLSKAFLVNTESNHLYFPAYYLTPDVTTVMLIAVLFAYPLHVSLWYQKLQAMLQKIPFAKDAVYIFIFLITLSMMASSTYNPFIYFKF
jgi:alginate O-acetyltransferase complex protein AlgI